LIVVCVYARLPCIAAIAVIIFVVATAVAAVAAASWKECSPGGGRRRAMTLSGRRRAAEGDRRRRLKREVDKCGGRWLQRQSRTKENGYAADEVLGIGAAQYSIFALIIFTPGEQVKNQ
jgi:hypothetical protein